MSYEPLPSGSPPSTPPRHHRSLSGLTQLDSSPSHSHSVSYTSSRAKVDLKSIEEGFSRWIDTVKAKGKGKGKKKRKLKVKEGDEKPELMESVFGSGAVASTSKLPSTNSDTSISHEEFLEIVDSVRDAMQKGVHPKLIAKGSSGSYFARDGDGRVVAVFKPKDEEPYGRLNPKWTKWVHRNFFSWIGWGRACLIPNLSYVSEAAASELDRRMNNLGMVPRTELVSLSSPSFFYDWIDRNAYAKKKKPLREKVGSFQTFMHGYKDATEWLKEHPWPGLSYDDDPSGRTRHLNRCLTGVQLVCGRAGAAQWDDEDEDEELQREGGSEVKGFRWTNSLKKDFWEELQKLICLDFLMRNTDRGLDNFMIKFEPGSPTTFPSTIISSAPSIVAHPSRTDSAQRLRTSDTEQRPRIRIAAIDNSLSFPHAHPNSWRSYVFGWLFLPVSLIGQPFSSSTRERLVPLLSSPAWWQETLVELRAIFEVDEDFSEKMWSRQVAVMKGQGYTLLESLRNPDEGPLELCRRDRYEVHDELVAVPDTPCTAELIATTLGRAVDSTLPTSPASDVVPNPFLSHHQPQTPTRPIPTRTRSRDSPRSPRASLDESFRPAPFAGRLQEGWKLSGATGVAVLNALERVDKAEREAEKRLLSLRTFEDDDQDDLEGGNGISPSAVYPPKGSASRRFSAARIRHPLKSHRSYSSTGGGAGSVSDRLLNGIVESSHEADNDNGQLDEVRSVGSLRGGREDEEGWGEGGIHGRGSSDVARGGADRGGGGWLDWGEANAEEETTKTRLVIVEKLKKVDGGAFFKSW